MNNEQIFFDTDIGTDVDDALALTILSTIIPPENVTVVTTNGPVKIRAQAAKTLLTALHRESIPVFRGKSSSLAKNIPFVSGLENDNVDLSLKTQSFKNFLNHISLHVGLIWISTGPLTTLATVCQKQQLRRNINKLFWMGGTEMSDPTLLTEHNAQSDSVAAKKILKLDIPLFLLPLNFTIQHELPSLVKNALLASDTIVGKLLAKWIHNWLITTKRLTNIESVFQNKIFIHDILAVSAALHPTCFSWESRRIAIDEKGVIHSGKRPALLARTVDPSILNNINQILLGIAGKNTNMI